MFVNQYKINVNTINSASTATTINIPINMQFQIVDQEELVQRVFVATEVEKAINPIFDYEKVRLTPVQSSAITSTYVNNLTYNLTFITGTPPALTGTSWADIGFSDDDIKFEKNSFLESFLTLSFYDTDNQLDQRLLFFITLFPRIGSNDLMLSTTGSAGQTKPAKQISVQFTASNPIRNPRGFSEGYNLYDYKDTILSGSKNVFMRASFNNAKTGKVTNLMVEGVKYPIDVLVKKLFTKYVLLRDSTGFFYQLDSTYSNNITYVGDDVIVNLYQIQVS